MKSSKLVIDTDKTNSMINSIKRSAVSMIDTIDSSKQSFSGISLSDTLSSGINTLSSNISLIGEKMMSISSNISNNFDSFSEMEVLYSNMVDSITVPTELNEVDNIFAVKTNDVSLDKKDGEAIKTDASQETEFEKEEKEKEEKLASILNETSQEATMDDINNIDYKQIEDMNNTDDLDNKELNDYEQAENIALGNITNEQTEMKDLDDYEATNETKLKDNESTETVQQELKDNYNIEKEQIDEMNTNNNTVIVQDGDEYDIESR